MRITWLVEEYICEVVYWKYGAGGVADRLVLFVKKASHSEECWHTCVACWTSGVEPSVLVLWGVSKKSLTPDLKLNMNEKAKHLA